MIIFEFKCILTKNKYRSYPFYPTVLSILLSSFPPSQPNVIKGTEYDVYLR